MGVPAAGQATEGHHAGMPRGFCAEHNRQETGHVRAVQPRPEGQNAAYRLSPTGRQGQCCYTLFCLHYFVFLLEKGTVKRANGAGWVEVGPYYAKFRFSHPIFRTFGKTNSR